MTNSMVRGMANTLYDKEVNPLYKDDWDIAFALTLAGWPVKDVTDHMDAAKSMAAIRFSNEARERVERCRTASEF